MITSLKSKSDFRNKTALITGGTRGIGAAIANALLQAGAKVIVTGRTKPTSISLEARFESVDFSNRTAIQEFSNHIAHESIDILVNNAGINKIASTELLNLEDFDRIHDVNLRAPLLLSKTIAPIMAKKGYGRILNIASIFGVVTKEQRVAYTTSKAGLIGLTKTLAVDFASAGILVNCLCPGFIDTELTRTILSPEDREKLSKATPLGRLGKAEEIAELALFMVSESNSFMTGQTVIADGGYTIV